MTVEHDEHFNDYGDDLVDDVFVVYDNVFVAEMSSPIKSIECDDTGKLLAFIEHNGTVTIWECLDDEWRRKVTWKYKQPQRPPRYKPVKLGLNESLVSNYRPNVITRWAHGHGRYLGIASDVSRKVHLFGENVDPPPFDRSYTPVSWHRKHTMISAAYITEMRFSPSHVEFTLVTATINGMVVVHMLQDKNNIKSWRPIHAIAVFRNMSINSLSWNQNPVHELPILIASTDDIEAKEGKQIAVFAINSPSVRPETNMCFMKTHHVSCVSFAPSSGLNDSLLAVAAGRKITLYLMNVEEFQVPEQFSPSLASESDDYQISVDTENESFIGSTNAESSSIQIDDKTSNLSTPVSLPSCITSNQNTASTISSDFSPLLPNDFFKNEEILMDDSSAFYYRHDCGSDSNGDSTEEEELEREPSDSRKALMWNVKWIAVFRETSAIKKIQWGRNPDNFTAQLVDGRIQSYKWSFGCVWSRSADLDVHRLKSSTRTYNYD